MSSSSCQWVSAGAVWHPAAGLPQPGAKDPAVTPAPSYATAWAEYYASVEAQPHVYAETCMATEAATKPSEQSPAGGRGRRGGRRGGKRSQGRRQNGGPSPTTEQARNPSSTDEAIASVARSARGTPEIRRHDEAATPSLGHSSNRSRSSSARVAAKAGTSSPTCPVPTVVLRVNTPVGRTVCIHVARTATLDDAGRWVAKSRTAAA